MTEKVQEYLKELAKYHDSIHRGDTHSADSYREVLDFIWPKLSDEEMLTVRECISDIMVVKNV